MTDDDVHLFKSLFSGAAPEALDPHLIPGFELVQLLGAGGMGTVYKARQLSMDRVVAVKVLKRELADDPEYVQRFLIEARTAGKLRHLNIVGAIDCGAVKELRFMVMEYVEGKTLDVVLKERGILDERVALEIVRQVAEGLDYAWRHGIIHRDIKPQNVLMTPDAVAKICDLGLCKSVRMDAKLTSTGYVNCTPTHASPEQARGDKDLDCRTDIYSLGVTFYQLVTGALPFDVASPADAFVKHATAPRIAPSVRNPAVSREVDDLILRMIDPDPQKRLPNPAAVVGEIRRLQALPIARDVRQGVLKAVAKPAPDLLKIAGIDVPGTLSVAVDVHDGVAVLHLKGKLLETLDQLVLEAVERIMARGIHAVVVECSGLQYLNSRAVSVFIAMADALRERNGDLKLAALSPQAQLVVDRLGLNLILQQVPEVEDALKAFASAGGGAPVPVEAPAVERPSPRVVRVHSPPAAPRPEHGLSRSDRSWKLALLVLVNLLFGAALALGVLVKLGVLRITIGGP